MIEAICTEIRNFFVYPHDICISDFEINGGVLSPSIDFKTDYIRIVGSRKNNGVYKVSELNLKDEKFHGAIWQMSIPQDFLDLVSEIEAWQEKNGGVDSAAMSPFNSESFGGYSYSKGNSGGASVGNGATWKTAYASRLNRWRRIRI